MWPESDDVLFCNLDSIGAQCARWHGYHSISGVKRFFLLADVARNLAHSRNGWELVLHIQSNFRSWRRVRVKGIKEKHTRAQDCNQGKYSAAYHPELSFSISSAYP